MSSRYTPPTGTNYTPGSGYRSPTTGGTSTYSDPFGGTKSPTSYQSTYQRTQTDSTPKTTYTSTTGGSYNPSGQSYNPSGTGYTPSGSGKATTNSTYDRSGNQPQSGGYTPQQTTYTQPKPTVTFSQGPVKADVKVEMRVEPIGRPIGGPMGGPGGPIGGPMGGPGGPIGGPFGGHGGPIGGPFGGPIGGPIGGPGPLGLHRGGDIDSKARLGKDIFKQTMNKASSVSPYESLITRLKATGEIFRDLEFPADLKSLTGGNSRMASKWASVVWRTPDEFWGPGYAVFKGGIDPNDIKQGALGDCYFLSTLSALAEIPDRISKLFKNKEANPYGVYAVNVCEMGEWREIVVDSLFPCKNKSAGPIFTRGNDQELWVLILEKAWAKIYGSYGKIEAGLTREVLHDLTGAPTEYFLTQDDDPEKIWEAIAQGEIKNYAMTCGSGDLADGADLLTSCGLVGSHAYSLLAALTVKTDQGPRRLVKLRNPWGEAEWKGDWSDDSSLWTPQLKAEVKFENKNDGIFYMSYEDFSKYFTDIQICRVHDDYSYSSHRFTASPKNASFLRFTVAKEGHYYITINQKSKRHFGPDFDYSDVYLIIGKELPNGEFEYVQGIQRADREVWTDGILKPGSYVAYVKVLWNDGRQHDVTISTYGYSKTNFETVPKEIVGDFLAKVYTDKAMKSPALRSYAEEGEPNAFRCSEVTDDGFGYFFFWNKSQSSLQTEIFFKIMSGIKLKKPLSGKSFKVNVAPGEKQIVLTRVNPYIEVKQVFSEVATFQRSAGQLKSLAKERGQKKQRKHQKTGEMVDIWCHVLQHSDGVYFYYENKTKDLILDEEVKFKLQGLKIEDDPFATNAKFILPPGQTKEIKLKKTLNEFSIGFSTAYLIKNA